MVDRKAKRRLLHFGRHIPPEIAKLALGVGQPSDLQQREQARAAGPGRQPVHKPVIIGGKVKGNFQLLPKNMPRHDTVKAVKLLGGDVQIAHGLVRTAGAHFGAVRPEGGGGAKIGKGRFLVGKGAEERSGKFDLAASPGRQPARPVCHMRVRSTDADAVAGLPYGLVIDAEDKIGMRDLAAKLCLFLLCQITPIALVLDYLQRTGRPATADGAAHLAGHAPCRPRRGPPARIKRDRRPVAACRRQTEAVQIAGLRRSRRGRVLRAAFLGKPEDTACVRVIVVALQPSRQLAIA